MSFLMFEVHEAKDNLFSKLAHLPKSDRYRVINEIIQDLKWIRDGKLGS